MYSTIDYGHTICGLAVTPKNTGNLTFKRANLLKITALLWPLTPRPNWEKNNFIKYFVKYNPGSLRLGWNTCFRDSPFSVQLYTDSHAVVTCSNPACVYRQLTCLKLCILSNISWLIKRKEKRRKKYKIKMVWKEAPQLITLLHSEPCCPVGVSEQDTWNANFTKL